MFRFIYIYSKLILASLIVCFAMISQVSAHLMVAQHGTLNFKNNGIFMVLSLPVSAFEGTDDDKDGKMSGVELNEHRLLIMKVIKENIVLANKGSDVPLRGLLISPVISHEDATLPSDQLVVMGRFPTENIATTDELDFSVGLFGKTLAEQKLNMTATRKIQTEDSPQKYKVELSPKKTTVRLFSK